jgi:mannitol operon transcriptional antiterminator
VVIALNTRCRNILMLLLQSERPLASREIALKLGITPRMVRYSLRDAERWLEEEGVCLARKRGRGILIDAPSEVRRALIGELEQLTGYSLKLSPSERLHILILALLMSDQPLLAKQLEPRLGISRLTVLRDMDEAERWFQEHDLHLTRRPHFGFMVVGEEAYWREAVVDFLLDSVGEMSLLALFTGSIEALRSRMKAKACFFRVLSAVFEDLDLDFSKNLVDSLERTLRVQFTDNAYASLVLHLSLLVTRTQQGKTICLPREQTESLRAQRVFHEAKRLAQAIEQHRGVSLAESEVAYIAAQVLGAKTRRTVSDIVGGKDAEGVDPEALEIADRLLADASLYLHPYLRADQQLLRSLVFHLEPALSRLRFNLPIRNPLLESVRKRYPYVFQVAQRSSLIIEEKVGRKIPEEEIGYIAMHLGAAMERLRPFPGVRRRVLVICGEGVATAWLLVSRMQAELPGVEVLEVLSALEVSRKHTFRGDADAIISTVPMEISGIPVIVVSPLLSADDRARIRETLKIGPSAPVSADTTDDGEEPSLAGLITAETIGLKVAANGWQDAVDQAGRLLLDIGAIEATYVEAMKENIMTYGPYVVVAPGVALLHARPEDGVKELCISIATLQSPVEFGHPDNDPVDLVIALGAVDNRSHLKALAQLVTLLRDREMIDAVRRASTEEEILSLVNLLACLEHG